jgi:hypothetical protein
LPKPRNTIFAPSAIRRLSSADPDGVDSSFTPSFDSRGEAMVARVATFEGVNMQEAQRTMDQADAIIRELVEGLAGYSGRLDLATQDGKMISITFFDSAENADAAEPTFDEEMPRRLGEIFTNWEGRRVSVGRYDVVADERR